MKDRDLIYFTRKIYDYMKEKSESYEGEASSELLQYKENFLDLENREFYPATLNELIQSIKLSQVIYLGDFHTFDQSSRNLQRLFRMISKKVPEMALGVEFVMTKDQSFIDQYLAHHITEIEFLEAINYRDSWRFPWSYYKTLFDLAKKNSYSLLALNSTGTLEQRDNYAAQIIVNYLTRNPQSKMLILFGEYHIAPNKMPAKVSDQLPKISRTIIHQNLDQAYWKIQTLKNKNNYQIIQYHNNEYSIQSSPPWIKYESMVYWYENLCEDPDFDIHEYQIESGALSLNSNTSENFHYICLEVSKSLNLNIEEIELEDFNLYDYHNLDIVIDKIELLPSKEVQSLYKQLIEEGTSFKLANTNSYYCPTYSINRLASLAGIHIQSKLNSITDETFVSLSKEQFFSHFTFQFTIAYFTSKMINPYRKCDFYMDLSEKKNVDPSLRALVDFLDLYEMEALCLKDFFDKKSLKASFISAKSLGYMLGELLFEAYYQTPPLKNIEYLIDISLYDSKDTSNLFKILEILLPKGNFKKRRKRFF